MSEIFMVRNSNEWESNVVNENVKQIIECLEIWAAGKYRQTMLSTTLHWRRNRCWKWVNLETPPARVHTLQPELSLAPCSHNSSVYNLNTQLDVISWANLVRRLFCIFVSVDLSLFYVENMWLVDLAPHQNVSATKWTFDSINQLGEMEINANLWDFDNFDANQRASAPIFTNNAHSHCIHLSCSHSFPIKSPICMKMARAEKCGCTQLPKHLRQKNRRSAALEIILVAIDWTPTP